MIAFGDFGFDDWQPAVGNGWFDGGMFWVAIECTDNGERFVGLIGGMPNEDRVWAVTKTDGAALQGRPRVVTHYCRAAIEWPELPSRQHG